MRLLSIPIMELVTVITITVGILSKKSVSSTADKYLFLQGKWYQTKNANAKKDFYGVPISNNAFALLTLLFLAQLVYVMKITLWSMGNVLPTAKIFTGASVMNPVGNNVNVSQGIISLSFKLVRQAANLTVLFLKTLNPWVHKLTAVFAYKICTGQMESVRSTVTMSVMPVANQQLPKTNVIVPQIISGLTKSMNVEETVQGMPTSIQQKSPL